MIVTSAGSSRIVVPTVSMKRPSRGERICYDDTVKGFLEPMRFKRIFTAIIYTSIDLITRASLTGFSDGVKSFSLQLKVFFLFFGMVIFLPE